MFLLEPSTTCLDLIRMVLVKIDVKDVDNSCRYFGLFESLDGASIGDCIEFDVQVSDVVKEWTEENNSKLVFMIRLFMPSITGLQHKSIVSHRLGASKTSLPHKSYVEAAEVIDSQLLHLQYIQAVYCVITGQYPTTPEQAIEFGVYHFLYKFGCFDETRHEVGFLSNRIVEFLPYIHLRKSDLIEWEKKLLDAVQATKKDYDPQRRYVETAMLRLASSYGTASFRATQMQFSGFPTSVLLNVHRQGINVVEKGKSRNILKKFHIRDIKSWGYKPKLFFYLEAKAEAESETHTAFEFSTKEGDKVSHLLTDYSMASLKESELEQIRCEELGIPLEKLELSDSNSIQAPKNVPPPPPPPPATPKAKFKSKPSREYQTRQHECATKIQSLWRGYILRWEWLQEDAAIIIQMIVRGFLARCMVSDMLEELYENGELELSDDCYS